MNSAALPALFFEEFASPAQKKRLKILETLLQLIIRDGLGELSLSKIARESKVPKSLILYHFPDLREAQLYLFKFVARSGVELTLRNLQGVITPLGQLEVIVASAFEWALKHPDYARYFLLMHHFVSVDERFARIHQESVDTGAKRLAACIEEILKRKLPKADLLLQGKILHSVLSMSILKMVTAGDYENVSDYVNMVEVATSKIIGKDVSLHVPQMGKA